MFKQLVVIGALFVLAVRCGSDNSDLSNLKAIGGPRYGGEFRFMSPERVNKILPLQAVDIYTQRLTSQLFDPILKLDHETGKILPCVAEKYSVSSDAKEFILSIRKGIFFHSDDCFGGDGRELTAADVKFTLEMACSGLAMNEISYLLIDRIKGARSFHEASKKKYSEKGVSGLELVDDYTLKIKLNESFAGFDKLLTYCGFGIFPKEAYETYGDELAKHPVGTGPFVLKEMNDKHVLLERNPTYWQKDAFGNQLPFLGSIEMTYATDKRSELMAFRSSKIDLVLEIPAEEVENVLGSLQEAQAGKTVKHKVDAKQSNSIIYVGLSHVNPVFKDVKVRRAFNLAIDRDKLVNEYLMGEGYPVKNGIIPPGDDYPAKNIKGFTFNAEEARKLLAEAGYSNGSNLPALTLYTNGKKDGDRHRLALGIAQQLAANLNIKLNVKLLTSEARDEVVASGEAAMWVSGWIADYPDADTYLSLFYGGNIKENSKYINAFKFKNAAYDANYLKACKELDYSKRLNYIEKCDQLLIDEAVVIPLINEDFITMINSRVRNFETNSLEVLDFSTIFIKEPRL